jgi:hypothetical protein
MSCWSGYYFLITLFHSLGAGFKRHMNKQQLLANLDKSWQQFNASFNGLTEEQMAVSGVIGDWSVKDIIAHVTDWEKEALKNLPLILQGKRTPRYKDLYGGINSFNAKMTLLHKNHSLSGILKESNSTHQQLVAFTNNFPDEMFSGETRFRRRLRLDTYSHYPVHTKAILEWRARSNC